MRVGLDVGGTELKAAALNGVGTVVATHRRATKKGPEGLVQSAIGCVDHLLAGSVVPMSALGVGIPGIVDRSEGTVHSAVNLEIGLEKLHLAAVLSQHFQVPCTVVNDVNAGAVGAQALGGSGKTADLVYLNIGTGVAASHVRKGRIWEGSHGMAGELGHITVQIDGEWCRCGRRGCLETVVSGAALARQWPIARGEGSGSALFRDAEEGSRSAQKVLDRWIGYLAWTVKLLFLGVDPDRIVIGGGVTQIGSPLLDRLCEELSTQSPGFMSERIRLRDVISLAPKGVPLGAIGAALSADGDCLDEPGSKVSGCDD